MADPRYWQTCWHLYDWSARVPRCIYCGRAYRPREDRPPPRSYRELSATIPRVRDMKEPIDA